MERIKLKDFSFPWENCSFSVAALSMEHNFEGFWQFKENKHFNGTESLSILDRKDRNNPFILL